MDSVVVLLQHSYHKVRFWAIDSLLSHMEPTDVEAIQKVLALLGDPESSVRWKTMMFLLRVPSTILDAALEGELPAGSTRAHGDGLRLLTRDTQDSNRIVSGLTANDPLLRRYAAVAAALLSESNPSPLRTAMNSPDSDIRDFARDVAESRRIAPDTH
jgi:HEAT repeat protein